MRVLHVIAPSPMGGAERVVHDSAVEQRSRGIEAAVLALLDPAGAEPAMVDDLRKSEVPVSTNRSAHRGYLSEARAIRRVATEQRADVVHCHGYRANVLGALALRSSLIPVVSTAHGYIGGGWKNRIYEWIDKRALRRMDAVIAVSRPLRSELERNGITPDALHLIPNAVRPLPLEDRSRARALLQLPGEEPTVGWIGRLSREKGPDVFLDGLARTTRSDIQAVFVGDGAERAALEESTRRLGLETRVRFTGSLIGAGRLLKAFDGLVLSSRTEGLPIVLLEAMAAAVPVVATDVGEISNVTEGGELARLIPSEDREALAQAIDDIVEHPESAAERARRARERVLQDYGVEAWIERLGQAYETAARRHRR